MGLAHGAAWALAAAGAAAILLSGSALATPVFDDVAAEAGVRAYYPNDGMGTRPRHYMGGGVCWGDFDGDGFEDLFVTRTRLDNDARQAALDPRSEIYASNGNGTFTDVSAESGVGVSLDGLGCSVADYDADGDLDLLYTGVGEARLFANLGAFRFEDVTARAGLALAGKCGASPCFATGSSWADVGGDGCLDLYVATYGHERPENESAPPTWVGQANVFFESSCDGTFVDATLARNLDDDPGPNRSRAFMALWCDFDADGDLDAYVASDEAPNSLLRQEANGTFTDVAAAWGVDDPRASMGLAFDDVNGDGACDLYMTHYAFEDNGFYVNASNGTFIDRSSEGDLPAARYRVGWGTGFHDFDNDGRKDLYAVNGHTNFSAAITNASRNLWRQRADGTFEDVASEAGAAFATPRTGRGSAAADYDFDGDVDLAIVNVNDQHAEILRATNVTEGWLEVQLRDPASANRFAVGAVVTVAPSEAPTQSSVLQAGGSFLSQNSYTLHFGLGSSPDATVTIRWPDGATQVFAGVPTNRVVRATHGAVTLETDVLAPHVTATFDGAATSDWFRAPIHVSLTADDRSFSAPSGVASLEWRIGASAWNDYVGPFLVEDGVHRVEHRATDHAGNSATRGFTVRVDSTAPSIELREIGPVVAGWHTTLPAEAPIVTDTGSGGAWREIRFDAGAWVRVPFARSLTPGDGERLVEARAGDYAGHVSATVARVLRVDATAPTTTLRVADGPALDRGTVLDVTSATRLALDATDAQGSGVEATEHRVDGAAWTPYSSPIGFTGTDRTILLEWRSIDEVGHAEAIRARTIRLDDARPPEVRPLSPLAGYAYAQSMKLDWRALAPSVKHALSTLGGPQEFALLAGRVPVTAEAGPDVSGVAWTRILVDDAVRASAPGSAVSWNWDTTRETPGWHVLTFEAADGRGNAQRVNAHVLVLGASIR